VFAGIYPGVTVARVRENTGWDLAVSPDLVEIDPPSAAELTALRQLVPAGRQASPPTIEGPAEIRPTGEGVSS
jgi:hypothetical protein